MKKQESNNSLADVIAVFILALCVGLVVIVGTRAILKQQEINEIEAIEYQMQLSEWMEETGRD